MSVVKPFVKLTEDEKMIKLYEHFLNNVPGNIDEHPDYFRERYNLCEFAQEKLTFMRAFYGSDKKE